MMFKMVLYCFLFLLFSCMGPIVSVPSLLSSPGSYDGTVPVAWNQYGACYLYDELFVETSYYSGWYSTPVNHIIYNKKMKILTSEGGGHANIAIPVYGYGPKVFRVSVTDASGNTVPLDVGKLKKEYLDKQVIVVPTVSAGSEITAYVEYETFSPITYYEHSFARSIPAKIGKLTFSHLSDFSYEFKSYNFDTEPILEERTGQSPGYRYKYHRYEMKNAVPAPQLEFQAYTEQSEKWVAIVLRRAMGVPVFANWARLSLNYENNYLPMASPYSLAMTEIVTSIKKLKPDTFAFADSLLQWVSEQITQDESTISSIRLTKVMESRKGNIWEITALLRAMMQTAGLPVDIVVTRSKEMGGFDKDFVAPMVLVVPLVVVTIGDNNFVAFPFRRGGQLGEYPEIFNGNYGLSLLKDKPVALPRSSSGPCRSSATFTIDCRGDSLRQSVLVSLYGGFAYETRSFLRSIETKKHPEFVQKWLTDLGTSNALETCSISGIHEAGKQLTINALFSNPNQVITKDRSKHIKLSTLFDKYYSSYDTLREVDFHTVRTVDDTETVVVLATGLQVVPSFECHEINNRLFSVSCDSRVGADSIILRRITHIDSVSVAKDSMKFYYPDIQLNNRITESSIAVVAPVPLPEKKQKRRL